MKWWGSRRGRHSAASHSRTGGAKRGLIPGDALRRRGIGATAAAVLVSSALVTQGGITTDASWNDTEWAHAPAVGTSACGPDGAGDFAVRGEGHELSGQLLGLNLDDAADVKGVETTNDGSRSLRTPTSAGLVGEHAYANPLDVEALNLAYLDLTGLLELPLETRTGVVGQYAQATTEAKAVGAAGTVTDDGGISLEQFDGDVPDLATLQLSELLNSTELGLGSLLQDVTDLELAIGAVGSRAWVDGCDVAWQGPVETIEAAPAAVPSNLQRDYLTSHVRTEITSPTVGALVTGVSDVIDDLYATVAGLTSSTALVNGILGGLTGLLGSLLNGLATPTIAVTEAEITLDPVRELLTGTITDSGGVLTIDLDTGIISVDTAALLAQAYPGSYNNALNGLPPNTDLLGTDDGAILTALTAALNDALGQWLASVENALRAAVEGISLKAVVQIEVSVLVTVTANVNGTLAELRNNEGVTASSSGLVEILLKPLVDGLISGLVSGLGGVVAGAVEDIVLPLVSGLPTQLTPLVNPVIAAVSNVYSRLFLSGIVSLTVNAQNAPAAGGSPPADWSTGARTIPDGRYDVAALRVGVLDALGAARVALYLGRASVGPGCSPAEAAAGGCAGY